MPNKRFENNDYFIQLTSLEGLNQYITIDYQGV